MDKIDEIIDVANDRVGAITSDSNGFPFKFEEVEFSVDYDRAGIYVSSGSTPVIAVERTGNPDTAIRNIRRTVENEIESIRSAVDARGKVSSEAKGLAEESGMLEKAINVLKEAGLPPEMLSGNVNREAADAIIEASRKAIDEVRKSLYMVCPDAVDRVGYSSTKMAMKVYAGGVVITLGGKPCLITRFPKVATNATIEKMVGYVSAQISAISESYRSYLNRVQEKVEKEEMLRDKAIKLAYIG